MASPSFVSYYSAVPDADRLFAMATYALPGIGPARARHLQATFGCFAAAWHAGPEAYQHLGLSRAQVERMAGERQRIEPAIQPERIENLLERWSVRSVLYGEPGYPLGLAAIHDPPLVVYIRGKLAPPADVGCAIVGTRRASPYGRWMAGRIAAGVARSGWWVISGMARGIDAAAHEAAMAAGGLTVAVLAGGLDCPYPPEHRALADRICDGAGVLLSEYLPGVPTMAGNFRARNRLISGLSAGVVVIEAGRRSGAISTASFAVEQGREVMAVPGRAGDPGSAGVHALIRDGAMLVEAAGDVIPIIESSSLLTAARVPGRVADGGRGAQPVAGETCSKVANPATVGDDAETRSLPGPLLLKLLSSGPASEAQLIAALGTYGAGAVRASLLLLELEGHIERHEGAVYSSRG